LFLKKWESLPVEMQNDSVKKYYDTLCNKKGSLLIKRLFDIVVAILTLIVLSPVFVILCIVIKIDSKGPILFRQIRVTQYGKKFWIFKFRTMIYYADKVGGQVTTKNDKRITKVGKVLRKTRLDEIPQLFNIIVGDMSFVGTRPEVVKYVERYTEDMFATLLLPAGVTSEASIHYKDEEQLLVIADHADETYLNLILPEKMKYNLKSLEKFSFYSDINIMLKTVFAVIKKNNYSG
jgi:lipopolysaccharide/colanic/teichoic acid biosynthesis glycosyltransferase